MRDYMDRQFTPPKQVTSPNWGPPPPCKQALIHLEIMLDGGAHPDFVIYDGKQAPWTDEACNIVSVPRQLRDLDSPI